MMLYKILEAHGGKLPPGVLVCFCNTGKERTETLDFVEECSQRWSVPIVWLEYRFVRNHDIKVPKLLRTMKDGTPVRSPSGNHSYAIVTHKTASRNGEPFDQVIEARYGMLPNVRNRFCTAELKERTKMRHLKSIGWVEWANAIGFRADEPSRIAKANANRPTYESELLFPLAKAEVHTSDVYDFWRQQPFDLRLNSYEGNCDLCFLKSVGKKIRLCRENPELATWWANHEQQAALNKSIKDGNRFRIDQPSYAALLEQSKRPSLFPLEMLDDPDELSIACHCTD